MNKSLIAITTCTPALYINVDNVTFLEIAEQEHREDGEYFTVNVYYVGAGKTILSLTKDTYLSFLNKLQKLKL